MNNDHSLAVNIITDKIAKLESSIETLNDQLALNNPNWGLTPSSIEILNNRINQYRNEVLALTNTLNYIT